MKWVSWCDKYDEKITWEVRNKCQLHKSGKRCEDCRFSGQKLIGLESFMTGEKQ